jgi:hypothetical protein
MAAFLTHLVIGERVWAALDGHWPGAEGYGIFLFGCLAPDVDKMCDGLEQGTTHFLPKDEAGSWTWQRGQQFLDHPLDFLRAPFDALPASEQAFVLGYLCHVAADEITGRLARALRQSLAATGGPLPNPDAVLTLIDPRIWATAAAPDRMLAALESATIPEGTFPAIPQPCLTALRQIVLPQLQEGAGLRPYVGMLRRQRHWIRHGQVSNSTGDAGLEWELSAYRRQIEAAFPASEQLIDTIDLEGFMQDAVSHSLQRIHALLAEEGEP